jgi:hypothetical protein
MQDEALPETEGPSYINGLFLGMPGIQKKRPTGKVGLYLQIRDLTISSLGW